jgi:hypothetical protein
VSERGARGKRAVVIVDDSVEKALAEIRQVTRAASIEMAISVGEIVFRHIFRGDVEMMRRSGPKDISFSRLALHPDLPMSAAGLWRSVAIYELSLWFPGLKNSKHLGVSHLRTVIRLPHGEQEKLLQRAEHEHWSVAELTNIVATKRTGHGGRRPKPEILKALDALTRVAAIPISTFEDELAVRRLSKEEVAVATETVQEIEKRLVQLRRMLNRRRPR